jgi:FixJ family two-component response regulator
MLSKSPLVAVVDDDESVRESLPDLLREFGYSARAFSSAKDFLEAAAVDAARCLIADISMPGMTGPELHRELRSQGRAIPVIFITAHKDEAMRARLLAEGAVDCLYKPFSDTALQMALHVALDRLG